MKLVSWLMPRAPPKVKKRVGIATHPKLSIVIGVVYAVFLDGVASAAAFSFVAGAVVAGAVGAVGSCFG